MRTLIRITGVRTKKERGRWKVRLLVEESTSLRSKHSGYAVVFVSRRSNYESEEYVRQKELEKVYQEIGTWNYVLYINATKYRQDPLHYQELVRNFKEK